MQIFVRMPYAKTITIDCTLETSIKQIKYLIYKKSLASKYPVYSSQQNLRYGSKKLINFCNYKRKIQTLKEYNIQKESTIHCEHKWHTIWCKCCTCKKSTYLRSGKKILKY